MGNEIWFILFIVCTFMLINIIFYHCIYYAVCFLFNNSPSYHFEKYLYKNLYPNCRFYTFFINIKATILMILILYTPLYFALINKHGYIDDYFFIFGYIWFTMITAIYSSFMYIIFEKFFPARNSIVYSSGFIFSSICGTSMLFSAFITFPVVDTALDYLVKNGFNVNYVECTPVYSIFDCPPPPPGPIPGSGYKEPKAIEKYIGNLPNIILLSSLGFYIFTIVSSALHRATWRSWQYEKWEDPII